MEKRKGCKEKENISVEQTFEGLISPFLSMSWTVQVIPRFVMSWTQELGSPCISTLVSANSLFIQCVHLLSQELI